MRVDAAVRRFLVSGLVLGAFFDSPAPVSAIGDPPCEGGVFLATRQENRCAGGMWRFVLVESWLCADGTGRKREVERTPTRRACKVQNFTLPAPVQLVLDREPHEVDEWTPSWDIGYMKYACEGRRELQPEQERVCFENYWHIAETRRYLCPDGTVLRVTPSTRTPIEPLAACREGQSPLEPSLGVGASIGTGQPKTQLQYPTPTAPPNSRTAPNPAPAPSGTAPPGPEPVDSALGEAVRDVASGQRGIDALEAAIDGFARAHGLPTTGTALQEMLDQAKNTSPDLKSPERIREVEVLHEAVKLRDALRTRLPSAAPPASAPATPQSSRPGGGLSKGTKIALAAGGAGAVLVAIAAGGGSGTPAAAPTTPTAPPTTPSLPPLAPAGIYDLTLTVSDDPGGNASRIGMEPALWINVTITGSTMQFTCPPGSHINPGAGPIDLDTGAFNVSGSGPFAGRSAVQFLFPGSFTREGAITGDYRVGTGGELPGGATTYRVAGRKR